jgi:hypothetical protein
MRTITTILLLVVSCQLFSQSSDTAFFPTFTPYSQDPIIDWNDFTVGSWADPVVLKEGNEYVMYTSAQHSGILSPLEISIYRFTSPDGYTWTMNPSVPVIEPVSGSYYESVETPSVVFYKGEYHMYNTVYTQNVAQLFRISHATSPDGINWQMDAAPILFPDPNTSWMSEIVGEPGALVKDDTLLLFFTAISNIGDVSIGLLRSTDGQSFIDTTQVVTNPTDVYPYTADYLGLSTPAAVLVGDTIYLFTDVVRLDSLDDWDQVGLHQFKSYGDITKWYHDTAPIHTDDDFTWTDGNYISNLLGPTPLMDGNKLRIWYWGYDLAQVSLIDTTYHVHQVGSDFHPDLGHWGIGTSEFVYSNLTDVDAEDALNPNITIEYHQNKGVVQTRNKLPSILNIYSISGQLLYQNTFTNTHKFNIDYDGIIIINVTNDNAILTKKCISSN